METNFLKNIEEVTYSVKFLNSLLDPQIQKVESKDLETHYLFSSQTLLSLLGCKDETSGNEPVTLVVWLKMKGSRDYVGPRLFKIDIKTIRESSELFSDNFYKSIYVGAYQESKFNQSQLNIIF